MNEATYAIAPNGLATSFAESELPIEFAAKFRNRFINAAGAAEKRQGMTQYGSDVPGQPALDAIHELVLKDGTAVLLVSGQGGIYKYDGSSSFSLVHSVSSTDRLQSVQMNDRLIFVNGENRNFFTKDGTTFEELQAIVEKGAASANTSAKALRDTEVSAWTATDVVANDLVHNLTRGSYALVTSVASAQVVHTAMSANATGLGATSSGDSQSGDSYEIIDLVELNVIPTDGDDDNVATAGTGTSTTVVAVSGVTFSTTDIRVGDYISNTTRTAVSKVAAVSANVNISPAITGQTSGDSLVFLKSAMPISSFAHVHYGRLYLVDGRDQQKIRISGADDPTDFTSDAGTIDSVSYNFGALQPKGDSILGLGSYQQFFAMVGRQNVYLFQGTNPIESSVGAGDADFVPVGLFPQGGVTSRGILSIGNDLIFVTRDGLQAVTQNQDATTLNRSNLSEAIRTTLRSEIANTSADQIILFHYPNRSWVLLKVGSLIYCYNYTTFVGQSGQDNYQNGSWSLFDGKWARQTDYFQRNNGELLACGPAGKVYQLDSGTFSDDGDTIATEYQTGWLTLEESKDSRGTVRVKQLHYIKPILEAGAPIDYTFRVEAPFDSESTDSITISTSGGATPIGLAIVGQAQIGGSPVNNIKYPLRARGEVMRLSITTDNTSGPDILSRFTLYSNTRGRQ